MLSRHGLGKRLRMRELLNSYVILCVGPQRAHPFVPIVPAWPCLPYMYHTYVQPITSGTMYSIAELSFCSIAVSPDSPRPNLYVHLPPNGHLAPTQSTRAILNSRFLALRKCMCSALLRSSVLPVPSRNCSLMVMSTRYHSYCS